MKIVLASTSDIKIAACAKAFARFGAVEIIPCKVPSGVPEQPFNAETLTGAFNRIAGARTAIPGADAYVSIENGLFEEGGHYIDRAVVAIAFGNNAPETAQSDGVAFPADCVLEAKRRGFDQWTVGKVMAEKGIVKLHNDPHLDLSGKSRTAYIDDALNEVLARHGAALKL